MNEEEFDELTHSAAVILEGCQYELDMGLHGSLKADEVSILFANEAALDAFVTLAVANGADNFNSVASDRMVGTFADAQVHEFDVRFEFLRIAGEDWRIEAMVCLDGRAPLHEAALEAAGADHTIFHVSYKLPSEADYMDHLARLNKDGAVQRALYRNSYGLFSYFGGPEVYMKPRTNLRDGN